MPLGASRTTPPAGRGARIRTPAGTSLLRSSDVAECGIQLHARRRGGGGHRLDAIGRELETARPTQLDRLTARRKEQGHPRTSLEHYRLAGGKALQELDRPTILQLGRGPVRDRSGAVEIRHQSHAPLRQMAAARRERCAQEYSGQELFHASPPLGCLMMRFSLRIGTSRAK
jgi:hypothetical protein